MDRIGISTIFFPRQESTSRPRRGIQQKKTPTSGPFDLTSLSDPKETRHLSGIFLRLPTAIKRIFRKLSRRKQDKFEKFRSLAPYYQEIFEKKDDAFVADETHTLAPAPSTPFLLNDDRLFFERKQDLLEPLTLKIQPLMCRGRLFHDRSGEVYLKLDHKFLTLHAKELPPNVQLAKEARIRVISQDESKRNHLWGALKGLGRNYYFTVSGAYKMSHPSDPNQTASYVLKVESEALNGVRKSNTLKPRLESFYIVLGTEKRTATLPLKEVGFFRIHPGINAV